MHAHGHKTYSYSYSQTHTTCIHAYTHARIHTSYTHTGLVRPSGALRRTTPTVMSSCPEQALSYPTRRRAACQRTDPVDSEGEREGRCLPHTAVRQKRRDVKPKGSLKNESFCLFLVCSYYTHVVHTPLYKCPPPLVPSDCSRPPPRGPPAVTPRSPRGGQWRQRRPWHRVRR